MGSGFWNAPLGGGETQALTAFNSVLGKFQFKCVPMGLQPASGFFQMWVEEALRRSTGTTVYTQGRTPNAEM